MHNKQFNAPLHTVPDRNIKETSRRTERQTVADRHIQTDHDRWYRDEDGIEVQRQSEAEGERETYRERQTESEKEIKRGTERDTERGRERNREKER